MALPRRKLTSAVISTFARASAEPGRDRLRTEAGEDRHGDRADLGARQKRDHRFRDHRQEQPDGIAPADSQPLERVREPAGLGVQLGVSEPAALPLLSFPDDGRVVAARGPSMAVEAVVGQIDLPADKPARPGDAVAGIQKRIKRPVELDAEVLDDRVPEPLDVRRGAGDQLAIAGDPVPLHEAADVRILDDLLGWFPDVSVRHETPRCTRIGTRPLFLRVHPPDSPDR